MRDTLLTTNHHINFRVIELVLTVMISLSLSGLFYDVRCSTLHLKPFPVLEFLDFVMLHLSFKFPVQSLSACILMLLKNFISVCLRCRITILISGN